MLSNIEKDAAEVGDNIRIWRKLLGLTAQQVAERAGISRVTYSKIENGDTGVSFGTMLKVFRSLAILEKVKTATDPYETDLGRARADLLLPQRVRR
jgi:transcriptional regulator with XRE-family HTH domain